MNVVWIVVLGYFSVGIISLLVLDLVTNRVKRRLVPASYETREKLAVSGYYLGARTALVVTLLALWLLWPAVIYAAVVNKNNSEEDNNHGSQR